MNNAAYPTPHLSRRLVNLGLMASLIISIALSIIAVFFMEQISTSSDEVVNRHTEKLLEVEDLRTSTERKAARSRAFIITGGQVHFQRFREATIDMIRQLEYLSKLVTKEQEVKQLELVQETLDVYQHSLDELMVMKMRKESDTKIAEFFTDKVFPLKISADQAINKLVDLERKQLEYARRDSIKENSRLMNFFQILTLICLGAFVALAYILRRTIRKQLEMQDKIQEALSHSNQSKVRFMDLANHLDQTLVWEATIDPLKFQFMSQRSEELLGIKHEELIASPQLFLHAIHPEDRGTFIKMLENSKTLGTDQRCEHRMIPVGRPNEVIWFQTGIHVRKHDSIKVYGMSVDITALKSVQVAYQESQEKLRAIVDNAPTAIYIVDKNLRYRMVNAEWEKLAKVPKEDAIGRHINDFLPAESRDSIKRNCLLVLDRKQPMEFEETIKLDGEEKIFLAVKFPVRDETTGQYDICGISRDITERKRSVNVLRQAVAAREEVLAVVSHDLRNPLNVVMMCAELIERKLDGGPEFINKQAGKIKASAYRMRTLIEDLLNLTKMSAGTFVLNRATHCGAGIVTQAMEEFASVAEEKSIRLVKEFEDTKFSVNCDHDQLIRVFENIFGNALKFTPPGGTITFAIKFPHPGYVTYSITDTGPGIAPELQSKVFNRYWQDEKTANKGTGLGLAIAKGIVEAHGGKIGVTSEIGVGSTFWFELPREA